MKKLVMAGVFSLVLLVSTSQAFAANNVSQMAVTKGGQSVAQCAQMMDKGVSECARASECVK